ncbi:FAD/NAD(P)-binding domain-containing protein [Atractiella rhizophila]|nr:FAD/NAD(P)-binding domain-containing protein [Atractiella rhizophila]
MTDFDFSKLPPAPQRKDVTPGKPTGIKVIIVGAGIGGLACAIECRIAGHEVVCIDQTKDFTRLGDSLGIFPNAGKLVYRWGIHDELDKVCGHSPGFRIKKYYGEEIANFTPKGPFNPAHPLYDAHRADMHLIFLDRARELGAEVRQGVRVTRYEDRENGGAVFLGDEKLEGDIIIAADGVKSKGREAVLGFYDKPIHSGYAIYRAFYDSEHLLKHEELRHLCPTDGKLDARTAWIGPDVHIIIASIKGGKEINWVMTHKDVADVEESWSAPGKVEDALKVVEGWDPVVVSFVKNTPRDSIVDWKLVYRDPLPTWVSPTGRCALLGDAAHPFLPTSQQGASMAVEDAATVAVCLKRAGKERLNDALKIYETLRYQRVLEAQKRGEEVRERWHKITDWEHVTPEQVSIAHPLWLFDHDATAYAEENFDKVVKDLEKNGYKIPNPHEEKARNVVVVDKVNEPERAIWNRPPQVAEVTA